MILRAGSLRCVTLDKTLHIGHASRRRRRAAVDLQVDSRKVVIRIVRQLPAVNGVRATFTTLPSVSGFDSSPLRPLILGKFFFSPPSI